jgi:hypothetical protein
MTWGKRQRAEVTGVHGETRRGTNGGKALAGRRQGPPVPREPRRLPLAGHMQPVEGSRDETCAHYSDCLTVHVMGHRGRGEKETPCRCPFGCRWYVDGAVPATEYASLNGAARGAT